MTETTTATVSFPIRFTDAPPAMRRSVRETALRVLYALDAGKRSQEQEDVLKDSADASDLDDRGRGYLTQLVAGTVANRAAIDAALDKYATDFPTHRQAVVDRNILRLATAEILFNVSDAPPGAVVNEAVELAKKYSTKDSGRFVNGVLGALVRAQDATFVPEPTELDMDEILPPLPQRYWGEKPPADAISPEDEPHA